MRQEKIMQMPVAITIEADIGYRSWRIDPDGTLHALFSDWAWPVRRPAEADAIDDGLGIHGWYRADEAWRAMGDFYDEAPHAYVVCGSVALFGDVNYDDDSDQYRATRAYPLELWETFDPETNRLAGLAAARYGIELSARPLLLLAIDEEQRERGVA
jgi:hypothetical protein